MDNREAVEYWQSIGCGVSPQTQIAALAEQNKELQQSVANLAAKNEQRNSLPAKGEQRISKGQQSKKPLLSKAKNGKESAKNQQEQSDIAAKDTEKVAAIDGRVMKTVRAIATLPELAGIAQSDIYSVIAAYQSGIGKSKIYQHLGWGSAKHTRIVKPVLDALEKTKETTQQNG